jgi:hypothetical protein
MNRLVLLLALLPAAALGAPPRHVAVQYELSRNGSVVAEVRETLEHDGASYKIVSEGRGKGIYALLAAGSVSRTSEGAVAGDGLRPRQFRDRRGSRETSARFDWPGKTLVQERKGQSESQPLPDNAQDRLSFVWKFAFAPPRNGAVVESVVADGRGAPARYRYAIAGTEVLKTAAGELETLHLVKQREPDDARVTEIWLAIKRDYVPVRILVVDKDGTRLDQVAIRIDG